MSEGTGLYLEGVIEDVGTKSMPYVLGAGMPVAVDWESRTFSAITVIDDASGASKVTLLLNGSLPNLPPHADAGVDETVECEDGSSTVTVSADASTDPDGEEDLASFVWSAGVAGRRRIANGVTWTTELPVGTHYFNVNVGDIAGRSDTDTKRVSVADTAAPEIAVEHLETDCLWPPNHEMYLFRLGEELIASASDVCDGAAVVRIVSVTSNQPGDDVGDGHTAPDVVNGSAAFCIRAERSAPLGTREYTVVLEARDDAGNVREEQVIISVPHRSALGARCASSGELEPVAPDDPRCSASLGPHDDVTPEASGATAWLDGDVGSPSASSSTAGCHIVDPSGAPGYRGFWMLCVAGAGLLARRRRWLAPAIACALLVGCGSEDPADSSNDGTSSSGMGEPLDPGELENCATGAFHASGAACTCTGSALDTPECEASDCLTGAGIVLAPDGRYASFVLNRSVSRGTASVVGGFAAVTMDQWSVSDDAEIVRLRGEEETFYSAECSESELLLVDFGRYTRAPADYSAAVLAALDSEEYTELPFHP